MIEQNGNQNEYVQNDGEIKATSYKNVRIIALIICLLVAFMVWVYAQNADNPLTENNMNVVYVCSDDTYEVIGGVRNIEVYGIQSQIYKYNNTSIIVNVDVNEGSNQTVKIELPSGIHFSNKDKEFSNIVIQKKAQ